jgi:hypothetical protein
MTYHTGLLIACLLCYGFIVAIRVIAVIMQVHGNAVITVAFCSLMFLLVPLSLAFHDLCPAPFGSSRPRDLRPWQRLKYLIGAFQITFGGACAFTAILILVENDTPWVSLGIDCGISVGAFGFYLCRVNRGLPKANM